MNDKPSPNMPWSYFVSYSHGMGYGSIQISCNQPADNYKTVDTFRKTISDATNIPLHQIVVLNYVLLSGPDTAGDSRKSVAEQALRDLLGLVDQFDKLSDPGRSLALRAFVSDVRQVALRGLGHHRG